ncbi:MAG: hypothetical protein RTU92_10485 [Candidatus Thorarchaeota archaeon]
MLGKDGSEQKAEVMERNLPPSIIIVLFPSIFCFVSILILTGYLPRLVLQYNYLRGLPSPIDQTILALLGSDLSRLVVFTSISIGIIIGLFLSHFLTTKLDVVRKEGEVVLSSRIYAVLFAWWMFSILPFSVISFLEMIIYGSPTSHFLSDVSFSVLVGYSLAFAIPVLLKYVHLVLHTKSTDSRVTLIEHRSGTGFIKRVNYLTLRVIHDGPDP